MVESLQRGSDRSSRRLTRRPTARLPRQHLPRENLLPRNLFPHAGKIRVAQSNKRKSHHNFQVSNRSFLRSKRIPEKAERRSSVRRSSRSRSKNRSECLISV